MFSKQEHNKKVKCVRNLCAFHGCSTTTPFFGLNPKFGCLVSTSGIPHLDRTLPDRWMALRGSVSLLESRLVNPCEDGRSGERAPPLGGDAWKCIEDAKATQIYPTTRYKSSTWTLPLLVWTSFNHLFQVSLLLKKGNLPSIQSIATRRLFFCNSFYCNSAPLIGQTAVKAPWICPFAIPSS